MDPFFVYTIVFSQERGQFQIGKSLIVSYGFNQVTSVMMSHDLTRLGEQHLEFCYCEEEGGKALSVCAYN